MESTSTITETSSTIMNTEPYKKTGLGERLKTARESLNLTEKEVSTRLHLNINIISLLENENFVDGPPPTFMRGYLRTYARLLNLSEDEIASTLKELENAIPSSVTAAPALPIKAPVDNERYLHWLTFAIVIVLVILVSAWWSSHSRYVIADVPPAQTAPVVTPTNETASATNTTTVTTPAQTQTSVATQTPVTTPAASTPAATPVPATTATPTTVATTPATPTPAPSAAVPPVATAPTTAAPATPITATTAPTAETPPAIAAEKQPTKPSNLSNFKMAIPEPDIDN